MSSNVLYEQVLAQIMRREAEKKAIQQQERLAKKQTLEAERFDLTTTCPDERGTGVAIGDVNALLERAGKSPDRCA